MEKKLHFTRKNAYLFVAISLAACLALVAGVGISQAAEAEQPSAQDETPTPEGQIQLPTATATVVGGPTSTPTRTPTIIPVLAEMLGDPTNLRGGPGLDFDIVGTVDQGTTLPIVGRSVTLPWYVVEWADGPDGQAWVYNQLSAVLGDITTVPIVEPPAAPTLDATQAIIQATATILLQTPGAAQTATAQAFTLPTGVYTATPDGAGTGPEFTGVLPTFTPPEPFVQPSAIPPLPNADPERGGFPPAVLIIGFGTLGILALLLGLLRRL